MSPPVRRAGSRGGRRGGYSLAPFSHFSVEPILRSFCPSDAASAFGRRGVLAKTTGDNRLAGNS